MAAQDLLSKTKKILQKKRKDYGPADKILGDIAARWSITLETKINAEQVVLCMMDLKHTRLCKDNGDLDSQLDMCGYASLLYEMTNDDEEEDED